MAYNVDLSDLNKLANSTQLPACLSIRRYPLVFDSNLNSDIGLVKTTDPNKCRVRLRFAAWFRQCPTDTLANPNPALGPTSVLTIPDKFVGTTIYEHQESPSANMACCRLIWERPINCDLHHHGETNENIGGLPGWFRSFCVLVCCFRSGVERRRAAKSRRERPGSA